MIAAIIQARLASTRLPGKVLADIAGRSMLWHIVQRVREATLVDVVVVATSDSSTDDPLEVLCTQEGFPCFRGSEDDVLDRFYRAGVSVGADSVVRVTGDCPLIDPAVIDRVVARYLEGGHDYVSNTIRYTYPDGLDVEVVSFGALERAWREAVTPTQREHVTPFIRFGDAFTQLNVESEKDLSSFEYRWTVDEAVDLEFVRTVYEHLYHEGARLFGLDDVLRLLEENPEMALGNRGIVPNEGAYKTIAQDPPVPARPRKLTRSTELAAATARLIPSSSQTFSKGPTQYVQGVAPAFLARGQGSHVWDVDGNEYIDCPMALGAVILGHNYPAVSEAVVRQMRNGVVFSLPHALEFEVAEKLVELIPSAEMVRFAKNGSDATAGAVRAARAYTNRDIVACSGYHGWQDWFIGTTTRNGGVPKAVQDLAVSFEYNNLAALERIFAEHPGQVAAVIMEPVGVIEPRDDFLKKVRELADREGALLIFDEIITGFRYAIGGAQEMYGVMPDLTCCGKAMANGYPLSAVVGRRDVMEIFDEIFFSFTFGGETMSLAAAMATLVEMQEKEVIGHLWSVGRRLRDGFNVLAAEFGVADHISCVGLGPRTSTSFTDASGRGSLALKSLFQQESLKRGVLFSGGHNMCFSHSDADVEEALHVYRTAMEICAIALKEGDVTGRLEGPQIQPVFRQA